MHASCVPKSQRWRCPRPRAVFTWAAASALAAFPGELYCHGDVSSLYSVQVRRYSQASHLGKRRPLLRTCSGFGDRGRKCVVASSVADSIRRPWWNEVTALTNRWTCSSILDPCGGVASRSEHSGRAVGVAVRLVSSSLLLARISSTAGGTRRGPSRLRACCSRRVPRSSRSSTLLRKIVTNRFKEGYIREL